MKPWEWWYNAGWVLILAAAIINIATDIDASEFAITGLGLIAIGLHDAITEGNK